MEPPSSISQSARRLFHPVTDRSTSCVLVRSKRSDAYFLVVSLSYRSDTLVVRFEQRGGVARYTGQAGVDVFRSEGEALDHLGQHESIEVVERGAAVLGYVVLGTLAVLVLATRTREAAVLPGGHVIRCVTDSKWLPIPVKALPSTPKLTPEEEDRFEMLPTFVLNGAHFYCETADVSRPFPSQHAASDPSWEFVWNRWLGASFAAAGCGFLCPHLLQGAVEARPLEDRTGQKYTLAIFSRRSRLHPGMRYMARGLNARASPGNEIECEQVVWTVPAATAGDDGSAFPALRWSSHVWRRGTVPIWWGVELKSGGVGEASIVVHPDGTYRGTRRYFQRLQRRYAAEHGLLHTAESSPPGGSPTGSCQEAADGCGHFPITCINLLRCSMQRKDELMLSEHFAEGVRRVRKRVVGAPVRIVNYDWHSNIANLREKGTVEGLWMILAAILPQAGMSEGTLQAAATQAAGAQGRPYDGSYQARWQQQQRGVLRYNCADSLDRTNAASYFAAVQVLVEQCRRLGLSIERPSAASAAAAVEAAASGAGRGRKPPAAHPGPSAEISSIHRRVRDLMRGREKPAEAAQAAASDLPPPPPYPGDLSLPPGWEARFDEGAKKTFYIDHNSKVTTWTRPAPLAHPLPDIVPPESPGAESAASQQDDSDVGHISGAPVLRQQTEMQQLGAAAAEANGSPTWGLLGSTVDQVRAALMPEAVNAQAEIFLINGDMNSNLYTSSRAMHSAIIGLLQGEGGSLRAAGVGRLANLGVSVQRRWNNVLSDASRQMVVELFLGLRLPVHLPGVRLACPVPPEAASEGEDSDDDSPLPTPRQEGLSPELVNAQTLLSPASDAKAVDEAHQAASAQDSGPAAVVSAVQPSDPLSDLLAGDQASGGAASDSFAQASDRQGQSVRGLGSSAASAHDAAGLADPFADLWSGRQRRG